MILNKLSSKPSLYLGLLLLSLSVGIWRQWDELLQWGLQQLLPQSSATSLGLSGARFAFNQAEFSTLQFELNTAFGPLALHLEEVKAHYNIRQQTLESLSVANAQLKFSYQPVGEAANNTESKIPVLPLKKLTVANLDLQIHTPYGPIQFAGQAEIETTEAAVIRILLKDTAQSIRLEFGSDLGRATVSVAQLSGTQVLDLTYQQTDSSKHQAHLEADAVGLIHFLSHNRLIPADFRRNLASSSVATGHINPLGMKIKLEAESSDNLATLQGQLMLSRDKVYLASAELALNPQNRHLSLEGHLDLPAAEFMVLVKPWLPETTQSWQVTQGTVLGNVDLSWQPQSSMTGSVHLKSRHVNLAIGSVQAEDSYIQLDVKDIGQSPMALTLEVPKLTIGKDSKLSDLKIKAQYQQNRVMLQQATLPILGGVLEISPDSLNIEQLPIHLTLDVRNLDLSQLLDSLNIPNLSGTGSISGKLPLSLALETIEVHDGLLKSNHPGVLHYQGVLANTESIAFSALRNLLYHSLQAKVNYHPNGDYQIGLRLEGKNPQILSGHLLAFNLNVHGQLPELLQKGLLAGNFEQPILEQVNGGYKH